MGFRKWCELRGADTKDVKELTEELGKSRGFGPAHVGDKHLFVKKGLKIYYIAYSDAERIFRRVRTVNAQMCCDNGEIDFEYLVVMADGKELIEVQLPGTKAAKMLMEHLGSLVPKERLCAP